MQHAILLVGHGTRNSVGQEQFLHLAEQLRAAVAPTPVEVAYIELQAPLIADALLDLHRQGCAKIILAPALLFAAGHAKQDIPAAVAAAQKLAPQLIVEIAEPLGCHPALLQLAAYRYSDARDGQDVETPLPGSPSSIALVLIGRGSSDPTAIVHCQEFAGLLAEQVNCQNFFTGFIAIAKPSLAEALEQAAASGAQQIIVQPHLLFSGEMLDSTAVAVAQARRKHPQLAWQQSDSLGADLGDPQGIAADYLVRAMLDRIKT
ncbi:sirohydrochlorin chelatase [Anatilimnocola floriformis]|uniref:sirohydrochlorin chelatase n=1 Tax=Anatilimnocola floriformis TaxID=2948575 RepID=UPI0020C56DA9|nr:CbiX/SirB N-terminal domain-containing protein [Anatilimnocola floriformis]